MKQLPEDWDTMYIGDGCHLHIPEEMQKEGCNIYLRGTQPKSWGGNGGSRCTEAILVSNKIARKILYSFNFASNIDLPVDHWFNNVY